MGSLERFGENCLGVGYRIEAGIAQNNGLNGM